MIRLVRGLGSSLGLKFLMGLTGLILFLFTVAHMVGNLQVFAGPARLNSYAKGLQDLGPLLWVGRIGLLATLLVHVASAATLARRNRAARPVPYALSVPIQSTYASRTMMMTGLIVLAFVACHLLHFTLGYVDPSNFGKTDANGVNDVHGMVVNGFRQPALAVSYIVAMLLLGLHLSHGVASFFQSLGWNRKRHKQFFALATRGLAALVILGNLAMPVIILLRLYPAGRSGS